ncbi:phosphatidate cytidylyltransferase [Candidatus Fokinia crypta]|uniref:Phosphatidate cytidylyltransferase n=1 Tax=Candidatus Fokinia crypta TaxID=1920990 RepID=A0ABZ0UPY3_9RICK|nr:phosphatidate cytidylyltransferase [Candidatus Fokinia cryptica]WPX98184.1 Phosphatidate cytidylyltransferase domain protein [Candidatus Fokinia cryptica]
MNKISDYFLKNNFIVRCFSSCFIVIASLCVNFASEHAFMLYLMVVGIMMIIEFQKMVSYHHAKIFTGIRRRLKLLEWMLLGIAYVLCFIDSMLYMRKMENGQWLVVLLFAIVWTTDTSAYISGKLFGKRCLPSYISPTKTYEGLFLSIIITVVVICPLMEMMQKYNIYDSAASCFSNIVLILILSIASHCGDLLESVLKRHFMVKDSGNVIPGHGGVLDRFDSMIFASIIMRIYLSL